MQARQRMKREAESGNGVWRSKKLALPHNERIFAREDFVGKTQFITALKEHLQNARPGLARCIEAALRQDVIMEHNVARLTASMVTENRKARIPTVADEMAALAEVGFRHEAPNTTLSRLVKKGGNPSTNLRPTNESLAQRVAESRITQILGEHFRRQSLISWSSLNVADAQNCAFEFNNFACSGFAFSFVRPLLKVRQGRSPAPTPVMFDVYARCCHQEDVEGFVERLERAQHSKKLPSPLLGVLAAYDLTKASLQVAKKAGLLAINLTDFFGKPALDALIVMESLLLQHEADVSKDTIAKADDLEKALHQLHSHPLIADIKGFALECVAALIIKADGWEDVRTGVNVKFATTTRDVDVVGIKHGGTKVRLIECKAHRKDIPVSSSEIKKFYTEAVPAFIKDKCMNGIRAEIHAEFWTTGIMGTEATQALKECRVSSNVKPRLLDKSDVLKQIPNALKQCIRLVGSIAEI